MKEMIGTVIDQLAALRADTDALADMIHADDCDEIAISVKCKELVQKYPANPLLISNMIAFLQIAEHKDVCSTYETADVKKLLMESCATFLDDIDLQMERYYFMLHTDKHEKEARQFLTDLKKDVQETLTP
jgi:hypothetical protein